MDWKCCCGTCNAEEEKVAQGEGKAIFNYGSRGARAGISHAFVAHAANHRAQVTKAIGKSRGDRRITERLIIINARILNGRLVIAVKLSARSMSASKHTTRARRRECRRQATVRNTHAAAAPIASFHNTKIRFPGRMHFRRH
jgi:hypothetical protein